MGRRSFSREFKLEAVRLVRQRGVSVAQTARDLDLHQNMLRNWVREFAADPAQAFPGQGVRALGRLVRNSPKAPNARWGLARSPTRVYLSACQRVRTSQSSYASRPSPRRRPTLL